MPSPDPYRDELRAAQDRIALLEEKLAARAEDRVPEEEEGDAELARLHAQRRAFLRWHRPRFRGQRSLTMGLLFATVASLAIMPVMRTLAHPNLGRAAIVALFCGVVAAALTLFGGVASARVGVRAVDAEILAAKRRLDEARRLRAIERELRDTRGAREMPPATGKARIAAEAEDPEEEVAASSRVARTTTR